MSAALSDELEGALLDAMGGDAWGPALQGRLRTVTRAILLRHGLGAAEIRVGLDGAGNVAVHVTLPPGKARVSRLVVSLGQH